MGNAQTAAVGDDAVAQMGPEAEAAILTGLDLQAVPPALLNMTRLKTLNLSRNQVRELPEELSRLTSLTSLFANTNRLTAIPSLPSFNLLTTVSIQSNRLRQFPSSLCQVASLTELELQGNQIARVPDSLAQLTNLQHLNLNRNRLVALPRVLTNSCLVSLNVCFNRLSVLPGMTSQKLRYIFATSNLISELPPDLHMLVALDVLMLDENRLDHLPESVSVLTQLSMLDVRKNSISQLVSVFHERRAPTVYSDVPSPIVPGLLLGNVSGSENRAVLRECGVTHIVRAIDALGQEKQPFPDSQFCYLSIDCLDTDEQDMKQFFDRSTAFISAAIAGGGTVLVHCRQGKSRSATLVIAYLIKTRGWGFDEAKNFVKGRRSIAGPNPSFCEQLRQYEKELTLL